MVSSRSSSACFCLLLEWTFTGNVFENFNLVLVFLFVLHLLDQSMVRLLFCSPTTLSKYAFTDCNTVFEPFNAFYFPRAICRMRGVYNSSIYLSFYRLIIKTWTRTGGCEKFVHPTCSRRTSLEHSRYLWCPYFSTSLIKNS